MNQEQRQQIKRFLDIIIRRKIIIIFCLLVSVIIGLGVYLRTPKTYLSSSLIMYQQRINPTQMSPDSIRFQEILGTVTQQITSRTSLETLITQFDLYKGMRRQLPMEDVVNVMRTNHIKIRPDRRGNTFQVSYQGAVPRTVLLVTNALASKFIEENIRYREEAVSETSAYVQDELNMAKETMNKKDASMRDFKLKYYNEMPGQVEKNISRLNSLQIQLQNYQNNLQELERTKVLIHEQISLRKDILEKFNTLENNQYDGPPKISETDQLVALRAKLDALLIKYKEKHPDVRRTQNLIIRIEEEIEKKNAETATGMNQQENVDLKDEPQNDVFQDSQIFKMTKQLEEIDNTLILLKKEKEETSKQIEIYKGWIKAAPFREAEWTDLTRDYDQFRNHYERLVAKNIKADSAQNLERRQKGSQFKIIDPAHFPEKPFQPDFMKIMLIAIAISLGVSGGIAFILEFLDTSFHDPHDLEKFLGLPVSCSIPVIKTDTDISKQRIKSAIWISLLITSLGFIGGGIVYLLYKGSIII